MEDAFVYWEQPPAQPADSDEASHPVERAVRQGKLTIEPSTGGEPVLVEEESQRVYRAADLPPETVLYAEAAPREKQPIVEAAKRAGFAVRRAEPPR